jgi:hypothetical protein
MKKYQLIEKLSTEAQNPAFLVGAVSGRTSSEKIIFFYDAFNGNREISAHILNDVFSEFEETFYKGKSYKNAMSNFKKYMKIAAENRGHKITINKVNKHETVVHGLKNVWSVLYVR